MSEEADFGILSSWGGGFFFSFKSALSLKYLTKIRYASYKPLKRIPSSMLSCFLNLSQSNNRFTSERKDMVDDGNLNWADFKKD